MTRVVIADDHDVVRLGLTRLLTDAGFEVAGTASSGGELSSLVLLESPDVCLIDLGMAGGGVQLIASMRRLRPEMPVLVLSARSVHESGRRSLSAGAAGYIEKSASNGELLEALETVAAHRRYVSPALAELLAEEVADPHAQQPHERLSTREYEVFRGLAAGHTVTELAQDLGISVKTVSTLRTRLLVKMRLQRNAELTRYALEHRLLT